MFTFVDFVGAQFGQQQNICTPIKSFYKATCLFSPTLHVQFMRIWLCDGWKWSSQNDGKYQGIFDLCGKTKATAKERKKKKSQNNYHRVNERIVNVGYRWIGSGDRNVSQRLRALASKRQSEAAPQFFHREFYVYFFLYFGFLCFIEWILPSIYERF